MSFCSSLLTVSRHSKDQQAKFGRGAGGQDCGYKFHAIYQGSNAPLAWTVTPLNANEPQVAQTLIDEHLSAGYLLGDANDDANPLYARAGQFGTKHLGCLTGFLFVSM